MEKELKKEIVNCQERINFWSKKQSDLVKMLNKIKVYSACEDFVNDKCYEFKIDLQTFFNSRLVEIKVTRFAAIYWAKQNSKMGLKEIGSLFGDKNHATILHVIYEVENWKETNDLHIGICNQVFNELDKKL